MEIFSHYHIDASKYLLFFRFIINADLFKIKEVVTEFSKRNIEKSVTGDERGGRCARKSLRDMERSYIGTDKEANSLVFILQCKSFQSRTLRRANSLTVSDGFSHVKKSITVGACARVISEEKKWSEHERDDCSGAADLYLLITIAVVTLCRSDRT